MSASVMSSKAPNRCVLELSPLGKTRIMPVVELFGSGATATSATNISHEKLSLFNVLPYESRRLKSQALDKFITGALRSLRVDGVLIVRQDLSKLNDPKKVAMLTDYFDVFRLEESNENVGFLFYAVNEVKESVYVHQNWQDYIWTLIKKPFPKEVNGTVSFRDFLDRTQYTDTGIFAYEWIFGDNFISPGGWDQNLAILKRFGPMKTGQTMLDIGVGIGGGARQAASEFGLHVLGVDLSTNMLAVALDRVHKEKDARVTYAVCDAVEYDFEPNSLITFSPGIAFNISRTPRNSSQEFTGP
ncbi:hypothetical protein OSTOST_07422 [Ostertagia ostertagi]